MGKNQSVLAATVCAVAPKVFEQLNHNNNKCKTKLCALKQMNVDVFSEPSWKVIWLKERFVKVFCFWYIVILKVYILYFPERIVDPKMLVTKPQWYPLTFVSTQ